MLRSHRAGSCKSLTVTAAQAIFHGDFAVNFCCVRDVITIFTTVASRLPWIQSESQR